MDVLEENFDDQDEQTVASTDHELISSSPRANFYPFWLKREPNVLKDSGTVVDPSPRNSIIENESTSSRYAHPFTGSNLIFTLVFRPSLDLQIPTTKYKISHSSATTKLCIDAEISPSYFTKIKIIGKGDVGRVFLVRGKEILGGNNADKLFAMKG